MRHVLRIAVVVALVVLCAVTPRAEGGRSLKEYARMKGQNDYRLQGLGLVVGLNGTGDSGKELAMARPLAEALRRLGNTLPSLDELKSNKSVAIVLVTATVPRGGAMKGDHLDLDVSVMHSASSLEGGMLLTAPLVSPVRRNEVYALGSGRVEVRRGQVATVGTVPEGGSMVRTVSTTPIIRGSFDLVVDQSIAGWGVTSQIASEINQQYLLTASRLSEPLAWVVEPRIVRVRVPEGEGENPAAFIGDVMDTDISAALRGLPAKVICDTRTGVILMTGDVQVSPAVITHKDLTVTTTVPMPVASINNPLVERNNWAAVETDARQTDTARLADLIAAFDQIDVDPIDQIQILQMLHKAGKLHAKLVIDGNER